MRLAAAIIAAAGVALSSVTPALTVAIAAERAHIGILVPLTGFIALEGTSQRNGAVLALEEASPGIPGLDWTIFDTATSPEQAVTGMDRVLSDPDTVAVVGSILGLQTLAMVPLATQAGVPLVTISGTAAVTEQGSDAVFRFFPGDPVTKYAHAAYAVDMLGAERPAVLYQTTAYGQSGWAVLRNVFADRGIETVFSEGIATTVRDLRPVMRRLERSAPDVLILHLHSASTALAVRAARQVMPEVPIVAGSALHQPSTAALLTPEILTGACAETAAAPLSTPLNPADAGRWQDFTARYEARFETPPDAFAVTQYDAVRMVLEAVKSGAASADEVRDYLASKTYDGLAMRYQTDGTGNMAHRAVIMCYGLDDTGSMTSRVVAVYQPDRD